MTEKKLAYEFTVPARGVAVRRQTAERAEDGWITLSTETPCPQDGLILAAGGWDLGRAKTATIKGFFNHATSGPDDLPILDWPELRVIDGKLQGKPRFADKEYPKAAIIKKLWDGGFLDDVSVSFRVNGKSLTGPVKGEDGRDYMVSTNHELLECSVVGIGADPNAGKGRMADAVTRGVITREEAETLDIAPEQAAAPVGETDSERIARLETEVAELRRVLETQAERLDRLDTQREQAAPPATPETAPVEEERSTEPEKSREQEIAEVIAAVKRRQLGRLPD